MNDKEYFIDYGSDILTGGEDPFCNYSHTFGWDKKEVFYSPEEWAEIERENALQALNAKAKD